uniref:Uncharacterized protein n=1 Tax=Lepeophtheirus salmonis TaxID=72036 RepID=A0A0K2TLC2_LEPSM
MFILQTIFKT